jgi:hypothetical protein
MDRQVIPEPRIRHCEPTGPAYGRPDDRLREAIQLRKKDWIASSQVLLAMTTYNGRDKSKSMTVA